MLTQQQISDRLELTDLVIRYANSIDTQDWDRLDDVFTPDARIDYRAMGGIEGSYPQIKAWLPGALGLFAGVMHFVGNHEFTVDGDTATGRVACLNPMAAPQRGGGTSMIFLALWYLDSYARTPGGWRISSRTEESCLMDNLDEALRGLATG
jgi:hypothetical protein